MPLPIFCQDRCGFVATEDLPVEKFHAKRDVQAARQQRLRWKGAAMERAKHAADMWHKLQVCLRADDLQSLL